MNTLIKAIRILRREGPFELLKRGVPYLIDNYVGPLLLPKPYVQYNSVDVNTGKYFDSIAPWRCNQNRPDYESGLVSGIEEFTEEGDNVVIVGGGWGVTAVKAAQKVGNSGRVTVYEGSERQINHVQETIRKHNLSDRVDVVHGIVGPEISLRGEAKNASRVSPEQLPECDVLELDCEGAEIEILENLTIQPRVILVESHGIRDSPSSKVEELLNDLSYSVKSKEIADRGREDVCLENDIYSLTAVQE
ncbi:FkbM family methyltransferase [Halostagnicola kamekurae]|uniref:Methyltransferase FkbM domain-containing protein n=1 Tax=Halostagnicola kamekurae TaxID=619731 RepID=A0A1I6Q703_9EURY|nr:FkbM family methyltransferase [Halostagnicola kamekurae]SFS48256.1 Methyltransferase FkbM domain-containing protein [Halostagnicola kamekurae]